MNGGGPLDKHLHVICMNPAEGREDAFNDWYSNVHIGEVLKVPGFVAAQRYRIADHQRAAAAETAPYRYMTVYEIEGDLASALAEMGAAMARGEVNGSDTIARPSYIYTFSAMEPRVEAGG
jgi:hypothetical protein